MTTDELLDEITRLGYMISLARCSDHVHVYVSSDTDSVGGEVITDTYHEGLTEALKQIHEARSLKEQLKRANNANNN